MMAIVIGLRIKLSKFDLVVLAWLFFDVEVRVFLSATYVIILQFLVEIKTSDSLFAYFWKQISIADTRWQDEDPVLVSVQWSAILMTPVCLLTILAIIRGSFYRHFFQLMLSFTELYSIWMIWSTGWIRRGQNLNYSRNCILIWIFMFLIYSLWIIFPLMLLADSWVHLHNAYIYRKRQLEWRAKFASTISLNSKALSRSTLYLPAAEAITNSDSATKAITNSDSATKQTKHVSLTD
ncbi:hypothetical protein BsWGS_03371 [Bradybaena similaris]